MRGSGVSRRAAKPANLLLKLTATSSCDKGSVLVLLLYAGMAGAGKDVRKQNANPS